MNYVALQHIYPVLNRRNNMEKLFTVPSYSDVKAFWSNYFNNIQKFYTDAAEDLLKTLKK